VDRQHRLGAVVEEAQGPFALVARPALALQPLLRTDALDGPGLTVEAGEEVAAPMHQRRQRPDAEPPRRRAHRCRFTTRHGNRLGAIGVAEFRKHDIHLHVPEGAIPKDGPSAGTAIAVSILSALRKRSPKSNIAMTGEVTLRGRVLGVGGVKEKVLAAHRAKITTVFLPKSNEKDLEEIPAEIKGDVTFVLVETLDELIRQVFPARRAPRKKKAR